MITKGKMLLSFYIFSPLIFQELYGDQFGEIFFFFFFFWRVEKKVESKLEGAVVVPSSFTFYPGSLLENDYGLLTAWTDCCLYLGLEGSTF